jgi:putative aminopeptidase FrvX
MTNLNVEATIQLINKLVSIPSPSGNTNEVITFVENFLSDLNVETKRNRNIAKFKPLVEKYSQEQY